MMKKVVTMCDPPSGWKWGFPKVMPEGLIGEAFYEWLISEGMPRSEIDYWNNSQLGYMPIRCWNEEFDE